MIGGPIGWPIGGFIAVDTVTPPVIVTTETVDVAGADNRPKRRRTGDEELTEAEVQWMFRKIAELKKAKEEEKEQVAKQLEVALAQAAQDDEAAEVITETIEQYRPGPVRDYSAVMRDTALLTSIASQLEKVAKEAAAYAREEDDIEVLLLIQ